MKPNQNTAPQYSLLIPTYNEAEIIEFALSEIAKEFSPDEKSEIEILIADDGKDNLPEIVNQMKNKFGFFDVQVLRNSVPLGKGKSLARGFETARAPIAGFMDVDLSTPPTYLKGAFRSIKDDKCDVYIGSRRAAGSQVNREQFFLKDILGNVLGVIARAIIFKGMRGYQDTQCGFKFYKTPLARVLYHNLMAGDGLNDLEVLIRANLLGCRVQEQGVVWTDLRESKRSLKRILWGEMVAITKIIFKYKIFSQARAAELKKLFDAKQARLC